MQVELVPFDARSPLLQEAVKIYVDVWRRDPLDSRYFFRRYAQLPHFRGLVAQIDNEIVGMTFGTLSAPGQWWHDRVAQKVGYDHPALQNAWVLTELAVRKPYRNRQIGGKLHDTILAQQPLPNVLLSTPVSNTGARRFYERRGYTYLHTGFAFQRGSPPYAIMHKAVDKSGNPIQR